MDKYFIQTQIALLKFGLLDAQLEHHKDVKHITNLKEAIEYWQAHPIMGTEQLTEQEVYEQSYRKTVDATHKIDERQLQLHPSYLTPKNSNQDGK